jgi:hypothetical protein
VGKLPFGNLAPKSPSGRARPFANAAVRPILAGRDWPLYGDEYGKMKFGNVPKPAIHIDDSL